MAKAGMQSGKLKEVATNRQVSLEGRTHLYNNHIFHNTQNLIAEN
jgi:hypothetical protein